MTCVHGMPNPRACIDCMEFGEGIRTDQAADVARVTVARKGCAAMALAHVFSIPEHEAVGMLEAAGWDPTRGRGNRIEFIRDAVEAAGFTMTAVADHWRQAPPAGTYLVASFVGGKGHAWVVEDGRPVNANGYAVHAGRHTVYAIA